MAGGREIVWVTKRLGYVDVTPPALGEPFIFSYVFRGEKAVLIVETGPASTADAIVEALEREKLTNNPIHVVVTHIHLDHGGGAGNIAEKLDNARIYVHPRGYKHLLDPARLWEASLAALGWLAEVYAQPRPTPEEKLVKTSDGQRIDLGGAEAKIIHTPGHASHHQSVLLTTDEARILFTGDSAGLYDPDTGAVVPTTPPPFRYIQYMESLAKQINEEPSTIAYTHIGFSAKGKAMLTKHYQQSQLWAEAVKELASRGITDPDEILRVIAERDPDTATFLERKRGKEYIALLLRLSVQGYLEDLANTF